MLLVRKMNLEREEGEITEYEDISSDEEILLRQRIAEIEAINLELASLSDKVDGEKENAHERTKKGITTTTEVVALANVNTRVLRRTGNAICQTERCNDNYRPKPKVTPARKRRRSRRIRKQSCQLIESEDEFDSYDQLPLGTENLSPDPLPIDDDDDDEVVVLPVRTPEIIVVEGEDDDEDDDLELKLRLEALQSKQEIKNDLQIILNQTQKDSPDSPSPTTVCSTPTAPPPPVLDEEQELRLIALKSAIVKKHLVRKKRKEEARPYSPTDDALENFDVPSPPQSAQNMDISPLGTPSPLSEAENRNAVDMEIANEESQSPIFFSCTINTEPRDPTALSHVEIQIDPSTMVADSGYDDEDPDKLRAFLLEKIGQAAKKKSMRVESDSLTESQKAETTEEKPTDTRTENVAVNRPAVEEGANENDNEDDEHVLRANLLSKAKHFKRAKSEEVVSEVLPLAKPLSEILNAQSKKQMELKTICRTIENPIHSDVYKSSPAASPKPSTPTRSALIKEIPSARVTPVVISLRASDQDSSSEFSEDQEDSSILMVDPADNHSPMSIAMDSPQYSSSPLAAKAPSPVLKESFDAKLSEFLKKARQSTGSVEEDGDERKAVVKLVNRGGPVQRIVTTRKVVKKVVNIVKTIGVTNVVQLGAPAAVKHLPPSTQLEYNRLINRMHQLERQKLIKSRREGQEPKKAIEGGEEGPRREASTIRAKSSPVKCPPENNVTVIRKVMNEEVAATQRSSIAVLVHKNADKKNTVIAPRNGEAVAAQQATDVPLPGGAGGSDKSPIKVPQQPSGRITLKDRLKSLTGEQMKMLWDVQQRKVVSKRLILNQSLDTFLEAMEGTMAANRQQIRTELEVRRLRRLLQAKEQQLAEQRALCSGQLHERLQGQYKTVLVARQSLATATVQCQEIGKSTVTKEGKEMSFRLTEEGAEGLGAKFKKYKTEIESYKELRGKIKRGVFTVADLKSAVAEVAQKVATEERHTTTAGPGVMDETAKKEKEQVVMVLVADTEKAQEAKEESQQLSKEAVEVISGTIAVGERVKAATNIRTEGTFPAYKSPLEHMEYLDTANPNGILCPFQLNGTCQDERCSYRHLAS